MTLVKVPQHQWLIWSAMVMHNEQLVWVQVFLILKRELLMGQINTIKRNLKAQRCHIQVEDLVP